MDGLKGFPEAIETVYPHAIAQLCIVHMVCNNLNYIGWNKRKEVAADLRLIYSAATIDEVEHALADFEDKWNNAYPLIVCLDAIIGNASYRFSTTHLRYSALFTPPMRFNLSTCAYAKSAKTVDRFPTMKP